MAQDKGFLTTIRLFVQSSNQGLGGFSRESYSQHDLQLLAAGGGEVALCVAEIISSVNCRQKRQQKRL